MEKSEINNRNHHEARQKLQPVIDNFESAVSLWWKNIKTFILLYWQGFKYALVPIFIILVLSYLQGEGGGIVNRIIYIIAVLFLAYFLIRIQIALYLYVINGYQGEPNKIFKKSQSYFWSYISVVALLLLPIIAMALSLLYFENNIFYFILIFSHIFILILPFYLIYLSYFTFSIFELFRLRHPLKSMKASMKLVSGYFWPVLGRLLFIFIAINIILGLIGLPKALFEEESFAYNAWDLGVQIIYLLIAPVIIIFFYSIYKDLVKIKDSK